MGARLALLRLSASAVGCPVGSRALAMDLDLPATGQGKSVADAGFVIPSWDGRCRPVRTRG